ncbi:V4R domain-containing protein [Altericista sp. CCNU0014]|uniref:V4R domain-containing protein n=1 Tax=Altericista sp. CCNU0014 TaxID=3082949 RepID=UPI00384B95CE
MISVKELVRESHLPSNYFAPDVYLQGDLEAGLIENRDGARLLALPDALLRAIYEGLAEEVGAASESVLYKCGAWWGKTFYRRFAEEVSQHHQKPIADIEMIEFLQCLKQSWKTHGWGKIDLDFDFYQQGFIVVKVWNSAFAKSSPSIGKPKCFVESGLLSSFFSGLTGQKLHCIQTTCESMGAECNHFVLGLPDRVRRAEAWLQENHDHAAIMDRLCQGQVERRVSV